MSWSLLLVATHFVATSLLVGRVLLRPHREPASRIAWIAVIASLPFVGLLLYLLLGETNIGFKRAEHMRAVRAEVFGAATSASGGCTPQDAIPERWRPVFRLAASVNGFVPVAGNRGELMADSAATIIRIVADIDAARENVHVLYYIWLADASGLDVVAALIRAAGRGVHCRVMADALGSRQLIASGHWQAMKAAGVHVAAVLSFKHPLLVLLFGRLDLRNHRKITVIDNRITYCGSQNCADAAFLPKARFAPWVDIVARFTGPIAIQNQRLFAADWQAATGEELEALWAAAPVALADESAGAFAAQAIGTGPTERYAAMPDLFLGVIASARRELLITTPYFVPNEAIVTALCMAARSGVEVTLILPRRNDSWIVHAASRSYYASLLGAGVHLAEFVGGLLHAKLISVDRELCLIGSANLDRRSFELNYENNILFCDAALTRAIVERQHSYLAASVPVGLDEVRAWSRPQLLWYNAVATMGPVL